MIGLKAGVAKADGLDMGCFLDCRVRVRVGVLVWSEVLVTYDGSEGRGCRG